MEEEGGGAPGTTVGSGSESIRSTASALRWVPQDLRALLILVTAGTRPCFSACAPTWGRVAILLPPLSLAVFHCAPGPSRRHSVPCVLPHVSLLTEQRRSRNEPRVPTPTPPCQNRV